MDIKGYASLSGVEGDDGDGIGTEMDASSVISKC
jgi:hypothetical protein